jgi:3-methylcrotonyl-CoA carboxylase alpha subunit
VGIVSDAILRVDGRVVHCVISRDGARYRVRVDGRDHDLDLAPLSPGLTAVTAAGRRSLARVARLDARWFVYIEGLTMECEIISPDQALPRRGGPSDEGLLAPMPGVVTQVLVREGDAVSRGQPLVIVEAMKMEHVIRAHRAGRVRALRVRREDQVEAGTVVADLDAEQGTGEGAP